ncbi:MAG: hypothetical protein LBL24_00020 [Bacteroidales bacterium]|jgi:hypothetical protein|nr:hypothetical protein [Bacteroidales bacterium]
MYRLENGRNNVGYLSDAQIRKAAGVSFVVEVFGRFDRKILSQKTNAFEVSDIQNPCIFALYFLS